MGTQPRISNNYVKAMTLWPVCNAARRHLGSGSCRAIGTIIKVPTKVLEANRL